MKKTFLLVGLLLPAAMATALVVWLRQPVDRPNVLLITIDTLRADHLGAYGYARDTSPNIDRLADGGVVFDNAFSHSILSGPSHSTMLTSQSAPVHGVVNNGIVLQEDKLTLAEILSAAGYDTAKFVSHDLMADEFGLGQGFDVSENHHVDTHRHPHGRKDDVDVASMPPQEAVFDAALAWLERDRNDPFFMWVHAQHPHQSWEPPPPYDRKFMEGDDTPPWACRHMLYDHRARRFRLSEVEIGYAIALYDGEIAFVDAHVGRILDSLRDSGELENTIVVITADHGEWLFDDDERRIVGHGSRSSDVILRVPLIVHAPQSEVTPTRVETLVGLIDLAPTVLELIGLGIPDVFEGTSLKPLLQGKSIEIRDQTVSCTIHSDGYRRLSIREHDAKLVCEAKQSWACELFDLVEDPLEQRDVLDNPQYRARGERMRADLERWWDTALANSRLQDPTAMSERAIRILRRAGYLPEEEDDEGSND